eukprot:2308100-Prymnesium_polylepis.1
MSEVCDNRVSFEHTLTVDRSHFAVSRRQYPSDAFDQRAEHGVSDCNATCVCCDAAALPAWPAQFLAESDTHGWPSFRDAEVVWENVRVLKASGEAVSATGSHLGHNIPDSKGNRYCINLVSVAGQPTLDGDDGDEETNGAGEVAEPPSDPRGDAPTVPGFFLWIVFVWVGLPALLPP